MPITRHQAVTEQQSRAGDKYEAAPTPLQRAIEALQLLTAESHINAALEAWAEVENQYRRELEEQGRGNLPTRLSFQLWALERFQKPFISRVEQWKHEAHFYALADDKQGLLRNVAKVFGTDIWVMYFVLGESITVSQKGLKIVLRIKKARKDLSLERLLATMETQREQRQGHRIPQLARQDPSIFSLHDMKQTRSVLLPTPPPPPRASSIQDASPIEVPMTPVPSTLPSLLPIFQEVSTAAMMTLQTPRSDRGVSVGTKADYEDSDGDVQVEYGRRANAPRLSDVSAFDNSTLCLEACKPQNGPEVEEYENGRLVDPHTTPTDLQVDHPAAYPSIVDPDDYEADDNGPDMYDDDSDDDDDDNEEKEKDDELDYVGIDEDQEEGPSQMEDSQRRKWGLQGQLLRHKIVAILDERHLSELQVGQQLSDEVMNYYIQSLLDNLSSSLRNQIFTRSSFFYEKMHKGYRFEINYAGASKWSNRVDCVRLQDAKYLLLPIAADGHWFLVVAGNLTAGNNLLEDPTPRRGPLVFVTVIDSLGARMSSLSSRIRVAEDVRDYICLEAKAKLNLQLSVDDFWLRQPQHVLEQPNGTDCGIYALEHARQFLNEPSQFLDNVFRKGFEPFDAVSMRRDIEHLILRDKKMQDYDTRLHIGQAGNRRGKQQQESETMFERSIHLVEEAGSLRNLDSDSCVAVKQNQVYGTNTSQVCSAPPDLVPKANYDKPNPRSDGVLDRNQMNVISESLQRENVRVLKHIHGNDKAPFESETTSTNIVWTANKRMRSPSPHHIAQRHPKKTRFSSNMKAISPQLIVNLIIQEKHLSIDLELEGVTREDLVEKGVWKFAQSAVINVNGATYKGLYPTAGSSQMLTIPVAEYLDLDVRHAQIGLFEAKLTRAERGIMSAQLLRSNVESSIIGTRKAQLLFSKEAELVESSVVSSSLMKGAIRTTQDAVQVLVQSLETLLTETEKLVTSLCCSVESLEETLREIENEKSS